MLSKRNTPPRLLSSGLDQELRDVLGRYLSPLTVDTVLRRVYEEEHLTPHTLTPADLEKVFQSSLFHSVRMFCKPQKLSAAMLDLADLLEQISPLDGK